MRRGPRRLGVFYKEPVPGTVKTRLVPPFKPAEAAALYEAFLEDTLETVRGAGADEVVLFDGSAPPGWTPPGGQGLRRVPQVGADLGARMTAALDALLGGGPAGAAEPGIALLVGSDAPTLSGAAIRTAFELLEQDRGDLVLGPSPDGGFILIGVARPPGALLVADIPWSAPTTLEATERRARALGWRPVRSPGGADVDTPEDLARLRRELEGPTAPPGPPAAPRTRRVLAGLPAPGPGQRE